MSTAERIGILIFILTGDRVENGMQLGVAYDMIEKALITRLNRFERVQFEQRLKGGLNASQQPTPTQPPTTQVNSTQGIMARLKALL